MLLRNRRIFIVEDNLENRAIMQIMLEQQGARTAIERWGQDTVKRLRAFAPVDVVLLDLMFPGGVSGFDIFEEIQKNADLRPIPVVAVSAADALTVVPKAQSLGFAGYISKPVEYDQFARQIAAILDGETVWAYQ